MESKIRFENNTTPKQSKNSRGNYKPRVKAKLDSHLLLKDEDKRQLAKLLDNHAPGIIEVRWDLSNEDSIQNRGQFLRENGLDIHPDDVHYKWSVRQSTPTSVTKQCISGSYRDRIPKPTSRLCTARYPYVGCLAFVTMSLRNGEICAASGYLVHSEECKASRPQRDPVYRLLPLVKKSVENLLHLNVRTADILARNAQTVKNIYYNQTLIGNHRTLLTAMDIANIKRKMLHVSWNIDVRIDAAMNLERLLGANANESDLKQACLHYQPRVDGKDRVEISWMEHLALASTNYCYSS
jgi:hypothetical protein